MKNKYLILMVFLMIAININLLAQNRFNECSAAFLNQKMIVDDYSPEGKCVIDSSATGKLTVGTVVYENDKWRFVDKISFKITIKDSKTKTLFSYSDTTYDEVDIKKVLAKCQKGDSILISLVKDSYALPHNEVLVN
jgi:hypothetical protein